MPETYEDTQVDEDDLFGTEDDFAIDDYEIV